MLLRRAEKLCLAGMAVLTVSIAAMLLWQHISWQTGKSMSDKKTQALFTPEDKLPQKLYLGQVPSVTNFTDANGKTVSLSEYRGRPVLVIFWAGWCEYCKKQLSIAQDIESIAERNGAKVLLINRPNSKKETHDEALSTLHSMKVSFVSWFDDDLAAYRAWGLQQIPTSVILDEQGRTAAYAAGVLNAGEYEGLFEYALHGGGSATLSFLSEHMTGQDGGVYCNMKISDAAPSGHDVLSETQGLLMRYAVLSRNKTLFDSAWDYTQAKMEQDGLAAWYVTQDGQKAEVNSALDDIRLWKALTAADAVWGGYAQAAETIQNAIYEKNVRNRRLVSFFEFNTGRKSHSLPLCYADIAALQRMAKADTRFAPVAENALKTVQGGYISDDFPLYYASFDYDKDSYSQEDLNTAEALYTLLHLAQAGEMKAESLSWLKERVSGDELAARYHVDGSAVIGYEYHSTAVYALAALIAQKAGDRELYNAALQKMERYRDSDATSETYGAFGDAQTGNFPVFDQCMPLLVYAGERP
jgi:thiol-disulfide isomerase/thioredoxin